ncbi:MAG: UvrD-helicase domain-containing protein, partial [Candidatus Gribaldobacteria bacterium]|nr:UvrD-helicase domain-containing protein [Candidatus Gribaldobacteria bacterium]
MAQDLTKLNSEQKQAVTYTESPLLIIAGAGTGKTTVITERIVYLIEQGLAKPEEILAVTFTEKAALEMEERVDRALPFGYFDLWVSTFHAFAERILKDNGLDIGLPTDFKLLNETAGWLLMR